MLVPPNLRRFLLGLGMLGLLLLVSQSAPADETAWLYQRSYFSHVPSPDLPVPYPQPVSRSAYRPAFYANGPAFWVQAGQRTKSVVIRSGNTVDFTILHDSWFQLRP